MAAPHGRSIKKTKRGEEDPAPQLCSDRNKDLKIKDETNAYFWPQSTNIQSRICIKANQSSCGNVSNHNTSSSCVRSAYDFLVINTIFNFNAGFLLLILYPHKLSRNVPINPITSRAWPFLQAPFIATKSECYSPFISGQTYGHPDMNAAVFQL